MKIAEELKDNFVEDMELLSNVWCALSEDMQNFLAKALAGSKEKDEFKDIMEEFSMGIHSVGNAREELDDMIED